MCVVREGNDGEGCLGCVRGDLSLDCVLGVGKKEP